ncbi:MAG: hypothetical protein ABI608_10520 [Rhizomicrobium sp.]
MSRLTFKIDPDAALVGVKRASAWTSLRAKLFGFNTGKGLLPLEARSSPLPIWQSPNSHVRRPPSIRLPMVPQSEPAIVLSFARQAKAAVAPALPASAAGGSAPFQIEYKDRLISASQLADGSWIATHVSLDADPSALSGSHRTHRFMARILAISSAEIEIDEMEQRGQS